MKRIFLLIACLGALLLSACGGESSLPNPTGKGAIRMINAIPGSPDIVFLIEETALGGVGYKNSSGPVRYDDLDYLFNFDIRYPDELALTRVASEALKVERDREHMFLLSGDINAPTITLWEGDIREFDESDTVFEARFGHASASLGDIDIYFDEPGTVLGTNLPVATLSFGEIADPADFEQGPYVITITDAGDLDTVHFVSYETSLLPQYAHVVTVFDGDGNNTAPVAVRTMTSVGNPLAFPDSLFPPQTRFIHAGYLLESVDVYDDELLTNLVAADVQFKAATVDLETTADAKTYYFTPVNSQATILFEFGVGAQPAGAFSHVYLVGEPDDYRAILEFPDRASALLNAKLRIYHGALNYQFLDVYVKNRDEPVEEEDFPTTVTVYRNLSDPIQLTDGSYDIYLTERDTKTELAGPYPIDVVAGDVIEIMAVDTADPTVIELIDVPVPAP